MMMLRKLLMIFSPVTVWIQIWISKLLPIIQYSDWIRTEYGNLRRFTEQLSVFSPNTGKYRSEKTPYLDTFHVVSVISKLNMLRYQDPLTDSDQTENRIGHSILRIIEPNKNHPSIIATNSQKTHRQFSFPEIKKKKK